MNSIQTIGIVIIFLVFAFLEIRSGRFRRLGAGKDDTRLEVAMSVLLIVFIQPAIFQVEKLVADHYFLAYKNAWSGLPVWAMTLILLVADDMTQYWWHRISHYPFLWPLHRAHHSASYMSLRVVYRNNFFYYAMMPGIWISGVLIYLGFGNVYVGYLLVKMTVIVGAHCAVPWDEMLYQVRWLRPVMWVVERTISTPATHYAHHAITMDDGIGYYKGNYGNLLFFWDVLFGTARITRKYPAQFGLRDDVENGPERWFIELFFPFFKSKRAHSALGKERVIID